MNLVDTSGWLEYFDGGPNAGFFSGALEDPGELIVPSICLYEAFRVIHRLEGKQEAFEKTSAMRRGRVVDLNTTLAFRAATLGSRHKLGMADSIILATARAFDATLWTQDRDFEGLPQVKYRPKRASRS